MLVSVGEQLLQGVTSVGSVLCMSGIAQTSPQRKAEPDAKAPMFKHILIPTDGSKLAAKGVKAGVKLARALGAKVTGLYVIFPYVPPVYGEAAMYYVPGLSPRETKKIFEKQAARALAMLQSEAKGAGVR